MKAVKTDIISRNKKTQIKKMKNNISVGKLNSREKPAKKKETKKPNPSKGD